MPMGTVVVRSSAGIRISCELLLCFLYIKSILVRLVDRRRTAGGASQGGCRRREVWTEYLDTRQRVDLVGKLILKEFRKNWGIALS